MVAELQNSMRTNISNLSENMFAGIKVRENCLTAIYLPMYNQKVALFTTGMV